MTQGRATMQNKLMSFTGKWLLLAVSALTLSGCTCACPLCSPTSCPGWQPASCGPGACHGYFPTCWRLWSPDCPPCPAPSQLVAESLPQPGQVPGEIRPPRPGLESGPSPSDAPSGVNQPSPAEQGAYWPTAPAPWLRKPPVFTNAQLENR